MTRERIAGLSADDWRRQPRLSGAAVTRHLRLVEVLRAIGQRHGRTPGEVAIAWVLRNPRHLRWSPPPSWGRGGPSQVAGVAGAAQFRLNQAEIEEIEAFFQSELTSSGGANSGSHACVY